MCPCASRTSLGTLHESTLFEAHIHDSIPQSQHNQPKADSNPSDQLIARVFREASAPEFALPSGTHLSSCHSFKKTHTFPLCCLYYLMKLPVQAATWKHSIRALDDTRLLRKATSPTRGRDETRRATLRYFSSCDFFQRLSNNQLTLLCGIHPTVTRRIICPVRYGTIPRSNHTGLPDRSRQRIQTIPVG